LGFDVPLQLPSPSLKARLMASIAETQKAEPHILRQDEGTWKKTKFEGVTFKSLYIDRETEMHTLILRLAPGAGYPRHRHSRPEQCLVLSGDVEIDKSVQLGPGDFEWVDGQTTHDSVTTKDGCQLLIIDSLHDEVLA